MFVISNKWELYVIDVNLFSQVSMKLVPLTTLTIGAIALTGLSSCTTNSAYVKTTNISIANQTQEEIKAGGGSSTSIPFQLLMNAYTTTAKNTKATFLPSSQTESVVAGVKDGLLDVGSLSRKLKPQENDKTLEQRLIAKDALLVATHPSVKGVTNLTTEDLKAIYSGKATNWKAFGGSDAKIVVLDRPEDESAKRLLREHYLGKDLKNASEAVVFRKEGELIDAIQSTPYSIGTFSLAYAVSYQLPVNRLNLNGIAPTLENMKAGKYKMVRSIVFVFKKPPAQKVQKFIDFVASTKANITLRQSGYLPLTQN